MVVEQSDGRFRYRLLETVRQYARERLVESGGAEAIRERHRDYFLALAEEADNKLLGARASRRGCDVSKTEHDNLRSALEWSHVARRRRRKISGSAGRCSASGSRGDMSPRGGNGARGSSPKARLRRPRWSMRGRSTPPAASPGTRPTFPPHGRCSSKALRFRGRSVTAWASRVRSTTLGSLAFEQGDYPAAQTLYEESLAVWRELGDRRGAAGLLGNLALVARECGDLVAARTLAQESLTLSREVGDQGRVADALSILGKHRLRSRAISPRRARSIRRASPSAASWETATAIATALYSVGIAAFLRGEFEDARPLFQEALAIRRELGDRLGLARVLEGCRGAGGRSGRFARPRAHVGRGRAIARGARVADVTQRTAAQRSIHRHGPRGDRRSRCFRAGVAARPRNAARRSDRACVQPRGCRGVMRSAGKARALCRYPRSRDGGVSSIRCRIKTAAAFSLANCQHSRSRSRHRSSPRAGVYAGICVFSGAGVTVVCEIGADRTRQAT